MVVAPDGASETGTCTEGSGSPGIAESVGGSRLGEGEAPPDAGPAEPDPLGEADALPVGPVGPAEPDGLAGLGFPLGLPGFAFVGAKPEDGDGDGAPDARRSIGGVLLRSGSWGQGQPIPVQLAGSEV